MSDGEKTLELTTFGVSDLDWVLNPESAYQAYSIIPLHQWHMLLGNMANAAYITKNNLRNGHRRFMQRLVRGRTIADDAGYESITEHLNKGLDKVKKSWAGMTESLSVPE